MALALDLAHTYIIIDSQLIQSNLVLASHQCHIDNYSPVPFCIMLFKRLLIFPLFIVKKDYLLNDSINCLTMFGVSSVESSSYDFDKVN
jgi:hypothetical protein